MDRIADAPAATQAALDLPASIDEYPFAYGPCTVECTPTAAEQAAYTAFYRGCRSAEDFWARAHAADWMLSFLIAAWDSSPARPEKQLRTFALRCVEGLRSAADAGVQTLLEAVRREVNGAAAPEALQALQASTHQHVAHAGAEGLSRRSPRAAALLAAWHAADLEAMDAALWASEFAARHDAFVVLAEQAAAWQWPGDRGEPWRASWRTAFFAQAHPEVEAAAVAEARRRQAGLLRSILPAPFGVRLRGEVYFGPVGANGRGPVYCVTCGVQRGDTTPGVLFDVRGLLCKACRAPVAACVH